MLSSLCYFTFFLPRLLCPPSSTLFPYTTLFRSRLSLCATSRDGRPRRTARCSGRCACAAAAHAHRPLHRAVRSEEHTSELQSPYDLVCRLLLEKKKKHENNRYMAENQKSSNKTH